MEQPTGGNVFRIDDAPAILATATWAGPF